MAQIECKFVGIPQGLTPNTPAGVGADTPSAPFPFRMRSGAPGVSTWPTVKLK